MEPLRDVWDVYAKQLFPVGLGHPLLTPEPDLATGRELFVGDVGFISYELFAPLFNTMKPATDPLNNRGVPTDFEAISLPDISIRRSDKITQDMVCSADVSAVKVDGDITGAVGPASPASSQWKVRSASGAGAFTVLETPGVAEDIIESRPYIVDYMRKNFASWFEFANTWFDLGLKDEEIIFLCGTLKTMRWGIGAFQGEGFRNKEGRVFGQLGEYGDRGFSLDWDHQLLPSYSSTGPRLDGVLQDPTVRNQCLFIHYYRMKRRTSRAAPDVDDSEPEYVIERVPPLKPVWDPVNPLLDYILDTSAANVAIASDLDVTGLFKDVGTFPDPRSLPEAIMRLSPPVEVDEHGVGTISVVHVSMHPGESEH
ncbi:hypothetical protein LXA43DRAFT_1093433 [Ganoderma leucocontextum]|nr:hypothetical protein LXA43DRAFT_1093433 [Ganoderma leucocontextum]